MDARDAGADQRNRPGSGRQRAGAGAAGRAGQGGRGSQRARKALIANENKINDAVAKGDKAAFSALVAADAWSVDGMGAMKVSDFAATLDQMKVKTWKISDEKVAWVDAEHRDRDLQVDRLGHLPGTAVPAGDLRVHGLDEEGRQVARRLPPGVRGGETRPPRSSSLVCSQTAQLRPTTPGRRAAAPSGVRLAGERLRELRHVRHHAVRPVAARASAGWSARAAARSRRCGSRTTSAPSRGRSAARA